MRRRILITTALMLLVSGQVAAAEKGKVLDLKFTVLDIGGRVQDFRTKESATEVHIELAADVLFDFDKDSLKPEAEATLKRAAALIGERAKGVVRIEGHTDAKGSEAYNLKLSERRGAAVTKWLGTKGGLGKVRFETRGWGAKRPVAPNANPDGSDNPDGRQANRRVEIIFKKELAQRGNGNR